MLKMAAYVDDNLIVRPYAEEIQCELAKIFKHVKGHHIPYHKEVTKWMARHGLNSIPSEWMCTIPAKRVPCVSA